MTSDNPYQDNIEYFMRRLYSLILRKPEIFKMMDLGNRTAGTCDDEIKLNYKHDILSTLIHEVLHYLHEDWSETKVLKVEKYLIQRIGNRRAKNILKRFTEVI